MSFFGIKKSSTPAKAKGKSGPAALHLCQPFVSATIVEGSLKRVVQLPRNVDKNEWLAANTFDFFNNINLYYGTISDFCTQKDCAVMSAGPGVEYQWTDAQKKNLKLSAPQYVDFVMTWIQNMLDDENIFPTKAGIEFPKNLIDTVRNIFRQLFRVLAHIYHHHFDKILHLQEEAHLNTLFAHFICFANEFDLLDKKELTPLNDLIAEMTSVGTIK